MARITVNIDQGARLQGEIRKAKYREARRVAEAIGRDMAQRANEIVGSKYQQRPFERRRHPGSRRLAGSIDYVVTGDDFPITVSFRVLGGEQVLVRALVLNFGKSGTTIHPTGNWPLRGQYGRANRFTRPRGSVGASGYGGVISFGIPDGVMPNVWAKSVNSPARGGDSFLEEARDWAVSRNAR